MPRRCSSWWPKRSWKKRWFSNCKRDVSPFVWFKFSVTLRLLTLFDKLIPLWKGFIQARRVLPAGLGEVRPAATPTSDEGGDLLEDVAGVVLFGRFLAHRGQEGNPPVLNRS